MAKYLFFGTYTKEGLPGLLKEGGTGRMEAVRKAIESVGGTQECFYYMFGEADVTGVADLPDNVSAAAFSLMASAGGGATVKTVVLMTPEEVDEATKKTGTYRPPGG